MAMALPPTHEGQEIEFYMYIMQDGEPFKTNMPVRINRKHAIDQIFEETPFVNAFTGESKTIFYACFTLFYNGMVVEHKSTPEGLSMKSGDTVGVSWWFNAFKEGDEDHIGILGHRTLNNRKEELDRFWVDRVHELPGESMVIKNIYIGPIRDSRLDSETALSTILIQGVTPQATVADFLQIYFQE